MTRGLCTHILSNPCAYSIRMRVRVSLAPASMLRIQLQLALDEERTMPKYSLLKPRPGGRDT